MKINFDINGMPEEPTIVLAYKDGRKIGKIKHENIVVKDNMANPNEISFATRKMADSIEFAHWKDIVDFRLAWWKEADAWFEIRVSMDESNETIKHVLCVHLGEAELYFIILIIKRLLLYTELWGKHHIMKSFM